MVLRDFIDTAQMIKDFIFFELTNRPLVANYEITGSCNLRCYNSGCYFFKNGKQRYNDISVNEWEKKFKGDKKNGIKAAVLTGGEPMLRVDMIKKAYNIFDGHITMITNGTFKVSYSKSMPDYYFVSLDGNEEVNDKIRGKGTFNKIILNIKNDKRAVIASTISEYNKDQIPNLVKIAEETNIKGITFALYTPNMINDTLVPRGRIIDKIINDIKVMKKEHGEIVLVSDRMLELFKNKRHVGNCYLKKGWVISYDPEGKIKRPCVLGGNAVCSECGCNIPIIMQGVREIDWETFRIAIKLFS